MRSRRQATHLKRLLAGLTLTYDPHIYCPHVNSGLYDETVNHIFGECAATEGRRRSMRITDSKILDADFELAFQFFECVLALLNESSSNLTSVETRLENAILAGAVSIRARR